MVKKGKKIIAVMMNWKFLKMHFSEKKLEFCLQLVILEVDIVQLTFSPFLL